jgi:hypothetical protein
LGRSIADLVFYVPAFTRSISLFVLGSPLNWFTT